ncbi:helix-turn-helix domain-containing protein [Nocardia brevicatena]|uniref:helix-turn-helix domain-containing protein n=1 Tax=Nocardia brevicatena TaxID=37327 RepID=UPI0012FC7317|nr:helix-turn-helix transcriptional regulator [Nocardia brevicatena]
MDLVGQPFVGPKEGEPFREWLRDVRNRMGLSRRGFAEFLGFPADAPSSWEAGVATPHIGYMRALRDKGGVPNELVRAAVEKFMGDPSARQDPPEIQAMMWELFATVPGSEDEKDLRNRIFEKYRYTDAGGRIRTLDYIVAYLVSTKSTPETRDDLGQTIHLAVLEAMARYNPARGQLSIFAWATARGVVSNAVSEQDGLSRRESREVLAVQKELDRREQSGQARDAATLADDMGLPVDRVEAALADIKRERDISLNAPLPGAGSDGAGLDVEDTSRPKADLVDKDKMGLIKKAMNARHPDPRNALFLARCLMRGDSPDEAVRDLRAKTNLTADDAKELLAKTFAILREVYADERDGRGLD